MIRAQDLKKHYRVHRRPPGLVAALKSVFHRKYEIVPAVDGVSFSIERGERVGFLGPNGAGKTTTLKVLSGLLHPTAGAVEVDGFEPRRRQAAFLKQITLVMGQKQQIIWDLPPSETFALNRAVFDVPEATFRETMEELDRLLDLSPIMSKPARQLSLGERMKCELAAALLHRPTTLFLDEPTIGLDVSMQVAIREFVRAYNERFSATVLLTSHYMEDVAALCPRVIVIDKGVLIYDGDVPALVKRLHPDKRVTFTLTGPIAPDVLERMGTVVSHEGARVVLQVPSDRVHEAVSYALGSLPITDLAIEDPPLETVMRQLFQATRDARATAGDAGRPGSAA